MCVRSSQPHLAFMSGPAYKSVSLLIDAPSAPNEKVFGTIGRNANHINIRCHGLPHLGLLPSDPLTTSSSVSFPCGWGVIRVSTTILISGSMTRPGLLLPPAPYSPCGACTRRSLLPCWLGVGEVGLEFENSHPL